jgi:cob(I)alamin adenosyltransferase
MGHRLSKISTRTGDTGTTGLGDGSRVSKDDLRIHAIGDVDELNSLIGVLLSDKIPRELRGVMLDVQHDLFDIGGELSIPSSGGFDAAAVAGLEAAIERYNADLPPLKEFILPGGGRAAAHGHLARTVCRRAERGIVSLGEHEPVNPAVLSYMNRLSDLLFIVARILARSAGGGEVLWNRQRSTE